MSAHYEHIGQRAGHEQAMRVLVERAIAHLGNVLHIIGEVLAGGGLGVGLAPILITAHGARAMFVAELGAALEIPQPQRPMCPASAPMREKWRVEEGRISGPS